MTRLTPLLTSLKTLNITYQTPQETLLDTPETLPTSEPATPQIGYTVQDSDLPVLSIGCYKKVYVAMVFGAGKFTTAGTLYYRMKKNGASVYSSSSSVSANYYYTAIAFFFDVKVGDLLELALWSSVSDSNWDYKAFQVQISRLIILNKPRLMAQCNFAVALNPTLTLGNPTCTNHSLNPYHDDKLLPGINTATLYTFLYPNDTYGIFRISYGDYNFPNTVAIRTSTSNRPFYYRNYVPIQIKFRGVRID